MSRIAVVGMACRYADATSPTQLWENVLASRRAFRRLPSSRLSGDDYYSRDREAPDRAYSRMAAVLEGYAFDRARFRVAGSTFRTTDMAHWLTLDTAAAALADAGFADGRGLPKDEVGVIIGNSLTGEFSRANTLRLRWPYVRRTVGAALDAAGWEPAHVRDILDRVEPLYKAPFPPVDEDTLAGSLSNTIAGRVCNYFDFRGGGYVVDGACSSSLLSVVTGCRALDMGELDVAVVGGVDVSIDPLELVGFAKTGALAEQDMWVYDRRSNGFWPGEGCGLLVLIREDDALAVGARVYGLVTGWGVSSDGSGGMTRPQAEGYRLMLERAYRRAGASVGEVPLFEGHGTGTAVGDRNELSALTLARRRDGATGRAAIGSVKAILGHTKAAAGAAGVIKTVLALRQGILPPTAGCSEPHELLVDEGALLRVLAGPEPWPAAAPRRAGVTAMGFGGINAHVVVEARDQPAARRERKLPALVRRLAASPQDVELLVVDGRDQEELRGRLAGLAGWVGGLSFGELADAAAACAGQTQGGRWRAYVVAASPEEAERRLRRLVELEPGERAWWSADRRAAVGPALPAPRLGLLFPGQGTAHGSMGRGVARRFPSAADLIASAGLPTGPDPTATEVAQPQIACTSLAGLHLLERFGVVGDLAVGHSLGELTALHWAGALDAGSLLAVVRARGRVMAAHRRPGSMVAVAADGAACRELIGGLPLVVAAENGTAETVIAGDPGRIAEVTDRARRAGLRAQGLSVSYAFHSPLMSEAARAFDEILRERTFRPLARTVVSTVTGQVLEPGADLQQLLRGQIEGPVRFREAIADAACRCDLLVEVGAGAVLTGLAGTAGGPPAVSLSLEQDSVAGVLKVLAAAWLLGSPVDLAEVFRGRLVRPVVIGRQQRFLTNPCEEAPEVPVSVTPSPRSAAVPVAGPARTGAADRTGPAPDRPGPAVVGRPAAEVVREMLAERAELPPELLADDTRLLDDLHLSSITVGQVAKQAAQLLGVSFHQPPVNLATATLADLADLLAGAGPSGGDEPPRAPAGAVPWVRAFAVDWDPLPAPAASSPGTDLRSQTGTWQVYAPRTASWAAQLRDRLQAELPADGTLVCTASSEPKASLECAFAAAGKAVSGDAEARFVVVDQGAFGAAALARTLRQESPRTPVTVIRLSPGTDAGTDQVAAAIAAEVRATAGFREVRLGNDGSRSVPTLRVLPVAPVRADPLLGPDDVLLVTGGGKGITAECAAHLARRHGTRVVLLGRSDPADDLPLRANLDRLTGQGLDLLYLRADVTDAAQVRTAIDRVPAHWGPVTAVLHGAGTNRPAALASLDLEDVHEALAPKLTGLESVMGELDPDRLKLLVTFGSIIGRAGLPGEAHYATANDWLRTRTEEWARRLPRCRTRCLEWSVWSGVGMGERLDVLESLAADGVAAIGPDDGLRLLQRLVDDAEAPVTSVITGRTGRVETLCREAAVIPLGRFVERPLVHYPGVELVGEVDLSLGSDPYLADHVLDAEALLPAVLGLEAMAQAAVAAARREDLTALESVEFLRPVVVPAEESLTVRVAATVVDDACAAVTLRCADTGFVEDHFRAVIRFGAAVVPPAVPAGPSTEQADQEPVPLRPDPDLYGSLLFQGPRFRRALLYRHLSSSGVDADVRREERTWFAGYLPSDLRLGDPGVRDSLMHVNQVCVPGSTLLPTSVARIDLIGAPSVSPDRLRVRSEERSHTDDTYVYDIVASDSSGREVERWQGLHLRAVRGDRLPVPCPPPLLGPWLERLAAQLPDVVGPVAAAVEPHPPQGDPVRRRRWSERALTRALGRPVRLVHRPDGRPEVADAGASASVPRVSIAHGASMTLAVASLCGPVGCDLEAVRTRGESAWTALLGRNWPLAEHLVRLRSMTVDEAGTRVWTAGECLRKVGLPADAVLTLDVRASAAQDRVGQPVVLRCGRARVLSVVTTVTGADHPLAIAVLTEQEA